MTIKIQNPTASKMVNRLIKQEALAEAAYQEHMSSLNKGEQVKMLKHKRYANS